ncbi:BRO family protein [Gordonia sp. FQ]|uniref:BRO family protein n=1 Tax=Gordonia sp. FQ TaxID=3446634 RepID=UPI003F852992
MQDQDSAPALFHYDDQTAVRVVTIDGEPWFVLADLCAALGISNIGNVTARLADDVKSSIRLADGTPGNPNKAVVSEPGMYEVVLRSDKPEVVTFRRWLTGTVLSEIRRTGSYGTVAQITKRDLAQMVIEAEDRADCEHTARLEAEQHAASLETPAAAWQHLVVATGDYAVADAAKILSRDPNISIGRDRLFAFMAAQGWVYRAQSKRKPWIAYQTQVDNGRLAEKPGKPFMNERTGDMELPAPTIRITAKGLAELHKRLGASEPIQIMAAAS